jgi:hypothetical protein
MKPNTALADTDDISLLLHTPEKFYFEMHREKDACDVIVRMDDGTVYTATFVTFAYLQRQMELNYQVTRQLADTAPVRYALIDTPHVMVESLDTGLIEDTVDNLIALDLFETTFTRVTELPTERTTQEGKRATQEVAAVVIADVLVVEE